MIDFQEKNAIYHSIHNIIKASDNSKQAAQLILELFENFMEEKESNRVSSTSSLTSSAPLFRRIG